MSRVIAFVVLSALPALARGQWPTTQLPPVGGRFDFSVVQVQDPYLCGDAVLEVARGLRGAGGTFSLPINCPRMVLRWPYTSRPTPEGDTLIIDTLADDAIVMRIVRRDAPNTGPATLPGSRTTVLPPRTRERREAGALIIDIGRRGP